MFRVKICGITSVDDVRAAVDAGADAIGLNFFTRSPRFVKPDLAEVIAAAVPADVARVGVFVNAAASAVCATAKRLGLHYVQLHGDEAPQDLAYLSELKVIRAMRCGPGGLSAILGYLAVCKQLKAMPTAMLLDAYITKGEYGGTGATFDWDHALKYKQSANPPPLVLAGGLTDENVAQAIAYVRPVAVDTASGVETSPGKKCPEKMARFVAAAKAALSEPAA